MTGEQDYKKIVEDKFTEWADLFSRMQEDADLVNLTALAPITVDTRRHLQDVNGNEIANSIGIVLNDPAVFANRVEAVMGGAIEQVTVTAQRRQDTAYVEEFIREVFKEADNLLEQKDFFRLDDFLTQQATRRGRLAALGVFQIENGVLIPEIRCWDTRYCVNVFDKNGLAIAGYKTNRSKDEIVADYPEAENIPAGKDIEVLNVWGRERNEIWVSGKQVFKQKNPFGYVPVTLSKVAVGSTLQDRNGLIYQAESIFFLIRDLVSELNRFVSIIQSINQKAVDWALQMKLPVEALGTPTNKPVTVDEVTASGTVNKIDARGGYELMPIGQLGQMADRVHTIIQARVDEAMGKVMQNPLQPKTATEILAIGQEQEKLITPRIKAKGRIKQALVKMLLKEVAQYDKDTLKVGNQTFEVGKLKGDFTVEFEHYFRNPMLDIARTSMAASQRGLIPDSMIRRITLQLEDPDKAERELVMEKAIRESPLLDIRHKIWNLCEEAKQGNKLAAIDAEVLCDSQYCPMLERALMGQELTKPEESVKPSQPLVPLLAGGNGNGG